MNWYLKVLKDYAVFTGRSRRKEYWMFALFNAIVGYVLLRADAATGMFTSTGHGYLNSAYSLAVLIPALAVAVRRMHDVGKSGWYILIPIYNFVLLCTDGDSGDNEYGSNPKTEEGVA